MINYYKIHDFLTVSVDSEAADVQEGYNHYFRHFKVDHLSDRGVQYVVRDFSEFRLPTEYRQDGPYVSFASGFCVPKQNYAIRFGDKGVEEYTAVANRATNLWMQALLILQGVSLVHGAGVTLGGKGILFAGFGGVGKTLLVSELRKRGDFMFFGDDYVIVDSEGCLYAYPADLSIYPHHLDAFPELRRTRFTRYLARRKMLSPWYEFKRTANFISRRITSQGKYIFKGWNANGVKVPVEFLIPKHRIGTKEQLYAGVFLTRAAGSAVHREEISAEEFADALTGNLLIEFQHAFPYLGALQAFGLFNVADFLVKQQAVLKQSVSAVKRYRLSIPVNINSAAATSAIVQQLEKIL